MRMLHMLLLSFIASFFLFFAVPALVVIPDTGTSIVMVAGIADWFTLDTFLYLVIIVLGGLFTLVTLKYRTVVTELKELLQTIRKAYADKHLTDAERKSILKEALDVVRALIMLAWKPKGLTAKAIKRAR